MSSPESPAPRFTTPVRVRYAETDAAGVVYHGNYLIYFEVARVELLRALGHPITAIEAQGVLLPVVEARGKGLMLAIECVQPGTKEPNAAVAKAFIAECQKHKVILMGACSMGNGVRFLPPLNISDEEMDIAMGVFEEAAKVVFA